MISTELYRLRRATHRFGTVDWEPEHTTGTLTHRMPAPPVLRTVRGLSAAGICGVLLALLCTLPGHTQLVIYAVFGVVGVLLYSGSSAASTGRAPLGPQTGPCRQYRLQEPVGAALTQAAHHLSTTAGRVPDDLAGQVLPAVACLRVDLLAVAMAGSVTEVWGTAYDQVVYRDAVTVLHQCEQLRDQVTRYREACTEQHHAVDRQAATLHAAGLPDTVLTTTGIGDVLAAIEGHTALLRAAAADTDEHTGKIQAAVAELAELAVQVTPATPWR